MFASDRRCCVCKDQNRRVVIHHIDENPSNNTLDNLAVLCFEHHAEIHSKTALARNLTQDLIRKYNEAWRRVCKLELEPHGREVEDLQLQQEVLLQISLIVHSWKVDYMSLYPGNFMGDHGRTFKDVWEMMSVIGEHSDTEEEWNKYRTLFLEGIPHVRDRLEAILAAYGDVVPAELKLQTLRTNSRLSIAQRTYTIIP